MILWDEHGPTIANALVQSTKDLEIMQKYIAHLQNDAPQYIKERIANNWALLDKLEGREK